MKTVKFILRILVLLFAVVLLTPQTTVSGVETNTKSINLASNGLIVQWNNIDYFKVTKENVTIYDNRSGELVPIGTLVEGQVYPRVRDYGNWHQIQFGNYYGYVNKAHTEPITNPNLKNKNTNYSTSGRTFKANDDITVYDNSSGQLVPFATIKKGSKATIASDYGNWWRVIISGRVGYIHKSSVTVDFLNSDQYFKVINDEVTIYDNRTGELIPIGSLTKNEVYPRVSDYGNWHRIQFGSYYGYVHKDHTEPISNVNIRNENENYAINGRPFLALNNARIYDNTSGKLIPFATINQGATATITSDYGNWYRVIISNRVGYVNKEHVQQQFTTSDRYFSVINDAPIYDNRTGKLIEVGTLLSGQTFERVSDYGNWHRIQFGDIYGYVRKTHTVPVNARDYSNQYNTNYGIGYLVPSKDIQVYDNTDNKLVPFGIIKKGINYQVIRDYGNWYEVNLSGRYGYVRKSDVDVNVMEPKTIVNPKQTYTYEIMSKDIDKLVENYPDIISKEIIGKSADNRNIYVVKLGKGETKITINGSTHAREWLTTNLLMHQIDEYSQAYVRNQKIKGYDVRELLNNVSIYYVPMVNPDGVTLVQQGPYALSNSNELIRMNGGSTNFIHWKANANGVDLNRNYPLGWNERLLGDPGRPASQNFKGYKPLSEPESQALANFTRKHDFKSAVSYHSSGEVLYWEYGQGKTRDRLRAFALLLRRETGYPLVPSLYSGGGYYTHWYSNITGNPSATPEISPYVGNRPVPISNYDRIWNQNRTVGLLLADEAYRR